MQNVVGFNWKVHSFIGPIDDLLRAADIGPEVIFLLLTVINRQLFGIFKSLGCHIFLDGWISIPAWIVDLITTKMDVVIIKSTIGVIKYFGDDLPCQVFRNIELALVFSVAV